MRLVIIIVVSFLFVSCSTRERNHNLAKAYCLMNEYPDSAITLLKHTDRRNFSLLEHAQYALFYSIAQDKSGLDVNKDTLLKIAYDYYKNKPNDSLYAKSNYYMGLYYQQVNSSKHAVDCFYNAINSAHEQHDFYTLFLASNRLSWEIYHQDPEEGLFYAKEALRYYEQLEERNPKNKVYLTLHLQDCYRYLGMTDSAFYWLDEALKLSFKCQDKNLIGNTFLHYSNVYTLLSMPDSALYYAKKAWDFLEYKEVANYAKLANCYLQLDSLNQAENLYKQIILLPASQFTKYSAYDGLMKICIKKKDFEHIQIYSDSAQLMLKNIYLSSDADNQDYRKEKEDLKDKNYTLGKLLKATKFRTLIYIIVLSSVLGLICFSFYTFRIASKKKLIIEKQLAQMHLEQEKHRHELAEIKSSKQKEILEIKHKSDIEKKCIQLDNLEKQLHVMKCYVISKMKFEQELELLKNHKRIHDITNDDWIEIELFLNETANGFMTSFRESFCNLKEKDFQLCMLLKLDFCNQDLTRFYGIKLESVKHKLLMLKTKLGINKEQISARDYIKMWHIN